jgi:hypothetical protein
MGTLLQVGDKFTLFKEKHAGFIDGSYFEALEDNGGFMMVTYLSHMQYEEMLLMQGETIHASYIKENNKVLFLIKFGESDLVFEVSFDPTLYKDKRAMQIAFNNHMVTFVSVEKLTNEIVTLRYANFPMELKLALIAAWQEAFEEKNFSDSFTNWVTKLQDHSVLRLWDLAKSAGYFGEKGAFE